MKTTFSDNDIDKLSNATHEHNYVETWESKRGDSLGRQIREFKCIGCGKIRQVAISSETKKGEKS